MSDDVKAARERITRVKSGERHRFVYGFDDEKMDDAMYRMMENAHTADLRTLADAYLAMTESITTADDIIGACIVSVDVGGSILVDMPRCGSRRRYWFWPGYVITDRERLTAFVRRVLEAGARTPARVEDGYAITNGIPAETREQRFDRLAADLAAELAGGKPT